MLSDVAPDEAATRVEAVTVTVKSNSITRHDFAPMAVATQRFRVDFGRARRALFHATNKDDANVVDGDYDSGTALELPVAALHFFATPEIRNDWATTWDMDHWTEGAVAAGSDGVTLVRFDFPER